MPRSNQCEKCKYFSFKSSVSQNVTLDNLGTSAMGVQDVKPETTIDYCEYHNATIDYDEKECKDCDMVIQTESRIVDISRDKKQFCQGQQTEPLCIDQWNWGAFLLNWLWGMGNSVGLAWFCFVPIIHWFMPFYLGTMGNRWAWDKVKNKITPEEFDRRQRNWKIAGFTVTGMFLYGVLSVYFPPP